MINPNEEKFTEGKISDDVPASSLPSRPEGIVAAEESELDSPSGPVRSSGDVWAGGRERFLHAIGLSFFSGKIRCRQFWAR
jgi:hypothetical protein